MKVLRKIIFVRLVTCLAIVALLNISVQLDSIMNCFPTINISYLLLEEVSDTGSEGETEKGSESFSGPEFFLSKQYHSIQTHIFNQSVGVFIHSVKIPPHPHFDKVTPPPRS